MTLRYYVGGVEQTDTSTRRKGDHAGLTSMADGSFGTSGIAVKDPTGILSYTELAEVYVEEDTCTSQPRCFTGRLFSIKTSRGPYLTGASRQFDLECDDLNNLLHLQPLRVASAKRPRETASARLTWLLGAATGLSGLVYDNGLVLANTSMYDEADYRDSYPDDVLIDICTTSTGDPLLFFVYWDNAAGQASLFYNNPATSVHQSTLRISNVPSDCDDIDNPSAVTFAMHPDPVLESGGSLIYCGVNFVYNGGTVYRHNATTHATYFGATAVHRVAVYRTDRVGQRTTAIRHADYYLANHSGPLDKITVTVKLPASKVNLIDAGMRLSARFQHFPAYGSFTWTRVTRRTLLPFSGTSAYYDVELELSIKTIRGGGGDPGVFPHVGCNAGSIGVVQSKVAGDPTTTLDAPATSGNMLIWVFASRSNNNNNSLPPTTGTWTFVRREVCSRNVAGDGVAAIYYKAVEAGDQVFGTHVFQAGDKAYLIEVSGVDTFDTDAGASAVSGVNATVSITPTAGKTALLISAANLFTDSAVYSPPWSTPATGMTELIDTGPSAPQLGINYRAIAATSGSYTVGSTGNINGTGDTADVVAAAFYCSASDNPPSPGQWFYDVIPTPVADGITKTFTLPAGHEFADRSLIVKVDRLDQTAALTASDGAARTFTLAFAPKVGELIEVSGQGR